MHYESMTTITIPKELASKGELVLIPRKDYDELLNFRLGKIRETDVTPSQKKNIIAARKRIMRGEFLTIHDLTLVT